MDRPPLPALTGIRFFAALHVVCFHYIPGLPPLLHNVAGNGYMAVGFFFILSGFVLAYNYAGRPMDSRKFLRARFARIYPTYLLGFLLIAPAVVARLHADPGKLGLAGLAAAGLLQGWFPKFTLLWNGPGWSLSNEAFFYLLFPAILPILTRLSTKGLWLVSAACWVAALAAPAAQLALYGDRGAGAVMYMPAFRLAEFVLGVAAGVAYLRRRSAWRFWTTPTLVCLAFFAVFSPFWVHALLRGAVAAPLFALLVCALASGDGLLGRFLSWRPVHTLGEASYAIYILQSPILAWFLFATRGTRAGSWRAPLGWSEFAIYVAILIAISLACHTWFEGPARRWVLSRRFFPGGAGAAQGCKIENDPYEPPDSAATARRSLHGLRTEV